MASNVTSWTAVDSRSASFRPNLMSYQLISSFNGTFNVKIAAMTKKPNTVWTVV